MNPLGVDSAELRLGWLPRAANPAARGLRQSTFQILAASSADLLARGHGDLWDSGKVVSDETFSVAYHGSAVGSSQRVFWKVRLWDQSGVPSAWSEPATWTMGILADGDWHAAKWIGAPEAVAAPDIRGPKPKYETVLLRREFAVRAGLKRAVAHVCGLGQYEMTLNAAKVGDDLLTPAWTDYRKTCLYDTYDITSLLRAGKNATGLLLGNGMYLSHMGRYIKEHGWSFGPLQAIGCIRLEYNDGSVETVATDGSWRVNSGPITFSAHQARGR